MAVLTMMKGLPLAYSKDMQEDKEQLFDAADTLELVLAAMAGVVVDPEPVDERMNEHAGGRLSPANAHAHWRPRPPLRALRVAHHAPGRPVAAAERGGR